MITIDGSKGEGGGQVLRSSLTLSLVTGRPIRIEKIRARRPNPGLQPQHLQAVKAATKVGRARVEGAKRGSSQIVFEPDGIHAGEFKFGIGTAGSTSLVLQTLLVPLSRADAESRVTITGGTHVPWSPSFHYLKLHWLPEMRQIGYDIDLELDLAGFYPKGGGRIRATIRPSKPSATIEAVDRGRLKRIYGISAAANLPAHVAERQRDRALKALRGRSRDVEIGIESMPSDHQGTMLILFAEYEAARLCSTGLGKLGKPAERVADEATRTLVKMLDSEGAVDPWMADQLVLPLSLIQGNSILRTCEATGHLRTNAEVVRSLLDTAVSIEEDRISIRGRDV